MTEIANRSGCSTVPHPGNGTPEHPVQLRGTPSGTPAERTSLRALAHKVLQAEHHAEQERNTPTKTPPEQRSIVPSGGTASGTPAEILQQRARLTAAAVAQGIAAEIIAALDDLDVDGCQWLDEPGLRRYAQIAQENHLRARGVAILRPTQPTTRLQPHPAITCASCQQQQQQPDTSDAGMHVCGKGHGLHYAREQHACADWKPQP